MPAISKIFPVSAALPKLSSGSESVWITQVMCAARKEIKECVLIVSQLFGWQCSDRI